MKTSDSSLWQRLDVSLGFGLLMGCAYTAVDVYIDHFMGAPLGAPGGVLEVVHAIVDLVLPAVTGASLGIVLHFTTLRAQMAAFEKQRANELASRLHKIERDQAVWVIAASLLHELKNPLHSLGLLLDEATELPDDSTIERKELLQRARAQSERLEKRLMALRSLENSPPPQLPRVELQGCIAGLLEPLSKLAERRKVNLNFESTPVAARAHPGYLRIIMENLVENSLDLLPSTGEGRIVVSLSREGPNALLMVSDNGPGLSEEARKRIFEPLFSRKKGGLGLGISIARGLARSMGGDLSVGSSSIGARFELSLRGADE